MRRGDIGAEGGGGLEAAYRKGEEELTSSWSRDLCVFAWK